MKGAIKSSRCQKCQRKIHLVPLLPPNRAYDAGDGEWQTSYGRVRWQCRFDELTGGRHIPLEPLFTAAEMALAMIEVKDDE